MWRLKFWKLKTLEGGQCCGSNGRAVTSDSRGPQHKSSRRQNLYYCQQYWKGKNKGKEAHYKHYITFISFRWYPLVWQDLAIFWTLGNFLKPLATIYHFYSEIIFRQLLQTFGHFYLVTLPLKVVRILFKFQIGYKATEITFIFASFHLYFKTAKSSAADPKETQLNPFNNFICFLKEI